MDIITKIKLLFVKKNMKIKKINKCDVYRDGGSLGLMYTGEDGINYQLFLKTRRFDKNAEKNFREPVIFLENRNSGKKIKSLNWQEAKEFIKEWGHTNTGRAASTSKAFTLICNTQLDTQLCLFSLGERPPQLLLYCGALSPLLIPR